MPRKYKIRKKKKGYISRILPDSVQVFCARRIFDLLGIGLVVAGLFILGSIISYDSLDPSINSSVGEGDVVRNWFGRSGSVVADIVLQAFGVAGAIFGIVFIVWGVRVLRRAGMHLFAFRILSLTICVIGASVAFSIIPSYGWMVQPYMGGAGGLMISQFLADIVHGAGVGTSHAIVALIGGFVAVFALLHALFLKMSVWSYAIAGVVNFCVGGFFLVYNGVVGFYEWLRHYGDDSHVKRKKSRKKRIAPVISKPKVSKDEGRVVLEAVSVRADSSAGSVSGGGAANIKVVSDGLSSGKVVEEDTGGQKKFRLFDKDEWEYPSISLLHEIPEEAAKLVVDKSALRMNAQLLQNVLADFNVSGEIVSIHPGPVVTLYELEPAPGTKTSRVIGLSDDIARSMSAVSVRASVVPGKNVIGIELPNKKRQVVYLRQMLAFEEYRKSDAALPLILGKDIGGRPVIADLARMPHLLIAGTTGSGKSVAVNTMILSLLYKLSPEKCRFIMIDPKMLELSVYNDIPHLLSPVVTDPGKAIVALKWAVSEMEDRYSAMSKLGVRNIDGYNARLRKARESGEVLMRKVQTGFDIETGKPVYEEQPLDLTELPYIVIVVDEFADLMLVAGKEVENAIQRLAQMARAAGIHLIMATQRPSVDVITGVIKANFPTRISFQVTSKIDSRTILGDGGAEQLLGMGDMLYMASGGKLKRVHGPYSSDHDVENVVSFLKSQAEPAYLEEITSGGGEGDDFGDGAGGSDGQPVDVLYDKAVAVVAREGKASTSFIQRHLQIGYNRAARIIEEMERQGVIGPANHVGKRKVLISDHSGESDAAA